MKGTCTSLQTGQDVQQVRVMSGRNYLGKCVRILGDFEEDEGATSNVRCISVRISHYVTCMSTNSLRASM